MFIAYQTIGEYKEAEDVLAEMKGVYPASYQPYMYHSLLLIMMENQKPNEQRDYKNAYNEYLKATELSDSADSKQQMQQLEGLIQQLKDAGWLN